MQIVRPRRPCRRRRRSVREKEALETWARSSARVLPPCTTVNRRAGPRQDELFVEECNIILRVFPEYFKRKIAKYIASASQNIADSLAWQLLFVQTAIFLVSENVNNRAQNIHKTSKFERDIQENHQEKLSPNVAKSRCSFICLTSESNSTISDRISNALLRRRCGL